MRSGAKWLGLPFLNKLGDNMKFKHGLVTAGCLAAMGLAGTAQAVQVAGELLEVYGNFYPQYQITSFADGSTGTQQSPMTAGLNTPATATTAPTKANVTQLNWVNSYIGFKGQKAFGEITAGYDLQGVTMASTTTDATAATANLWGAARDAFVFVAHKKFGTLQLGQMDTIYKEFGDRVRLLGTSSSNFTSTSSIVSGVTWKGATGAGTTSFNTRINGQVRWISPNWSGVEVGVSIRPDPARTTTTDASLSAMGIRWSNDKYYVGLAQEVHNDYRTVSGTTAADAGTTIFSVGPRSKDTATRLSFGYTAEKYKLGADFSSLKYTEDATAVGNFSSYDTTGWQVTGEYSVNPQITVGGNYGQNAAGSCSLLGVTTCSTNGLGGSMLSLGARYDYDKNIGFFALYGKSAVNSAAVLAGGNVGGDVTNVALGLQVKF
jgi:predicted porin